MRVLMQKKKRGRDSREWLRGQDREPCKEMEMASGSSVTFAVVLQPGLRISALRAPLTLEVRESHLMVC